MATAMTTTGMPAAIEAALINGDLSKLDAPGRLQYYKAVCESLGLNPLTKPFDYINLNGKLTLYAKRDCTDQLRRIYSVSITNLEPKQLGDLFVVVASAKDGQGRIDSSTGAVNTAGLKGENLANAMMKCETKAKRRVTLSLCGLGLLDETEVETIREIESERPKPPIAIAQPAVAILGPASINKLEGNTLRCNVKDVSEKKTPEKGQPYLFLAFDNRVGDWTGCFCWHKSLFDVLKTTKGKNCQFEVEESKGRLSIDNILAIGEQEFRNNQPFNPDAEDDSAPFEATNADLPESLFSDTRP